MKDQTKSRKLNLPKLLLNKERLSGLNDEQLKKAVGGLIDKGG